MSFKNFSAVLILTAELIPFSGLAAWQTVATEQGKRVEIDNSSIVATAAGVYSARGRIVLDKPIVDPRTSVSYRIIEITTSYDCDERTHATLKRSYYKDDGELLRQEEVKQPFDMPVRSGTPDDRLLREVCRPKNAGTTSASANQAIEKANEAAAGLRQFNEELIEKEVKKDLQRLSAQARSAMKDKRGVAAVPKKKEAASPASSIPWAYEGSGSPDQWGKLRAEYSLCASGKRQSPIDLREGIAVDLEPIQFSYRPSSFRVTDTGKNLMVLAYGGSLGLLGKNYVLTQIQFHRPAETTVAGKVFDMEAQLTHRSEDGQLAIVSILLEKGSENPVIQTVLNNLPLEKGGEVSPPAQNIDLERLLPGERRYYTFMGSLTTPPCSEEVLWLVLKQPQQVSPQQLSIFERLYKPNARPVMPTFGRIIKESR